MKHPIAVYRKALEVAVAMLESSTALEVRSALRQAAADSGVGYGAEMDKFVRWAEIQLSKKGDADGQGQEGA